MIHLRNAVFGTDAHAEIMEKNTDSDFREATTPYDEEMICPFTNQKRRKEFYFLFILITLNSLRF